MNLEVRRWRFRSDAPCRLPEGWQDALAVFAAQKPARIAVVVHVHYPELLNEILTRLAGIGADFDLFVTDSSGTLLEPAMEASAHLRTSVLLPVPNRGRDMLPFMYLVGAGLLDPYDLVLKLHTKKSEWRAAHAGLPGDGDGWRESLLDGLVGDAEVVGRILGQFDRDPRLGLIAPPGNILGPQFWGGNLDTVRRLAERARVRFKPENLEFVAGSMFWGRAPLLLGLKDLRLTADDFETEGGQIDGTTAHAVERFIGIMVRHQGYTLGETE